jgi:hypothetical protein
MFKSGTRVADVLQGMMECDHIELAAHLADVPLEQAQATVKDHITFKKRINAGKIVVTQAPEFHEQRTASAADIQ